MFFTFNFVHFSVQPTFLPFYSLSPPCFFLLRPVPFLPSLHILLIQPASREQGKDVTNLLNPMKGLPTRLSFPSNLWAIYYILTKYAFSTNKYYPPSFPQHSTASCLCTLNRHLLMHILNCHLLMHTLFVCGFMNMPIPYQQHKGCSVRTTALLHPAASTQKLECPPLLLAPLSCSGTRLRRSSIHSTTTFTSFLQLPTTAAPLSFTQLLLLLEVRMFTPYLWHHSLARVRLCHSSIHSTTIHVSCSDHSFKTCS